MSNGFVCDGVPIACFYDRGIVEQIISMRIVCDALVVAQRNDTTVGETCEYTFSTIVLKRIIRYIDLCFTVLTLLGE